MNLKDIFIKKKPPKLGYWIRTNKAFIGWFECSNCGHQQNITDNYCPNCGFEMKNPNEDKNIKLDVRDSSGREVKLAVLGPIGIGYQCPNCGMPHCSHEHCLRCGQPLVYEEYQFDTYVEHFKDVDEECKILDERAKKGGRTKNPITGEKYETLTHMRKRLLKEYPNVKQVRETIYD